MASTVTLQEKLFAEMKGRIKEDDSSVPAPDGAFDYYSSFVKDGQHPTLLPEATRPARPRGSAARWQCAGEGTRVFPLRRHGLTPDQKLIAWSFDGNGSEFYELRVRDTAKGEDVSDVLENTAGGATWAADGKSFFYTLQDDNHRPLKTFSICSVPRSPTTGSSMRRRITAYSPASERPIPRNTF